jgi:methionyl-tRNA formyltransferase
MTRFAYAGDRQIAVDCLAFLLNSGARPEALLVSSPDRATHDKELRNLAGVEPGRVLVGTRFRDPEGIELLRSLDLDYIVGVHFPYFVPDAVLEIPRIGVVNLHPAFLPFNRGWHTPSWAILDQTATGATLHFMDNGLDTGDIVAQTQVEIRPEDTADTLYQRLLEAEARLFEEAWPLLESGHPPRLAQLPEAGTSHSRKDLGDEMTRRLDLERSIRVEELIRRLRALTTNDVAEAAYFEVDGRRYRVQITITPE